MGKVTGLLIPSLPFRKILVYKAAPNCFYVQEFKKKKLCVNMQFPQACNVE